VLSCAQPAPSHRATMCVWQVQEMPPRISMELAGGDGVAEPASASHTFSIDSDMMVPEPIATGMVEPSQSQSWEKLKGDAIPWMVTALCTLPFVAISKSMVPALVVALIDIAWFVYSYLQAQAMNVPAKPEPASRDLLELWDKCLTESPDGPEDFVVGWFYDAPLATITREDVENWLAWGCFSTTWEMLVPESRSEALLVLEMIEQRLKYRFPPRGPGQEPVACMRFTIEPMEWTHKPLMFYAMTQGLLGGLGTLSLWNEGFSRHHTGVYDYWVRMPSTEEGRRRTPIFFVHGIGVGLVMYLEMIKALNTHDCPIICLELPFISSNIAPKVPNISEQVESIDAIFERWGLTKAMFVGHSYGSVILSWMAQQLPSRVAGLVFIDPVVMMLNLKNILFNFLYKHEGDGKISDLIGTELHINNALRRNFWWYRNIVWASDLQRSGLPSLVCLSEKDEIVPTNAVKRHIEQHAKRMGDANVVDSYIMHGANHGEMLFDPEVMEQLQMRINGHYVAVEEKRARWAAGGLAARYPRSLANVFGTWEALVQLRWGVRRSLPTRSRQWLGARDLSAMSSLVHDWSKQLRLNGQYVTKIVRKRLGLWLLWGWGV
jgi:pimeloyl-ACP methyl ester carboxylesterase